MLHPQPGSQPRLSPFGGLAHSKGLSARQAGAGNSHAATDQIGCFLRHQTVGRQLAPGNRCKIFEAVRAMIDQRKTSADGAIVACIAGADQGPDTGIGPDVAHRLQGRDHLDGFAYHGVHLFHRGVNQIQIFDSDRRCPEDGNRSAGDQDVCTG